MSGWGHLTWGLAGGCAACFARRRDCVASPTSLRRAAPARNSEDALTSMISSPSSCRAERWLREGTPSVQAVERFTGIGSVSMVAHTHTWAQANTAAVFPQPGGPIRVMATSPACASLSPLPAPFQSSKSLLLLLLLLLRRWRRRRRRALAVVPVPL